MDNKLPVINYQTLKTLQADMEEAFEEVYLAVFTSIQSSIEQLQQLPLDIDTITRLFHSIKSPAASLGAEQLASLAADYETLSRQDQITNLAKMVDNINQKFTAVQDELKDFKVK